MGKGGNDPLGFLLDPLPTPEHGPLPWREHWALTPSLSLGGLCHVRAGHWICPNTVSGSLQHRLQVP